MVYGDAPVVVVLPLFLFMEANAGRWLDVHPTFLIPGFLHQASSLYSHSFYLCMMLNVNKPDIQKWPLHLCVRVCVWTFVMWQNPRKTSELFHVSYRLLFPSRHMLAGALGFCLAFSSSPSIKWLHINWPSSPFSRSFICFSSHSESRVTSHLSARCIGFLCACSAVWLFSLSTVIYRSWLLTQCSSGLVLKD